MPELPEVETTRTGIESYIKNQCIIRVNIYTPKLRWPIPHSVTQLEKQIIKTVARRGKYLILYGENTALIVHLGMSGYLQILPASTPLKEHDHFEIIFENNLCLRLNDARRFGAVLDSKKPLEHKLLCNLGPEPLSLVFNTYYLFKKTRNIQRAVKLLIMDSHIVAGVGNIYANEALFLAKLNPNRLCSSLNKDECKRLTSAIKKILKQAIKSGGTTLKDFQAIDGKPGYFKQKLRIYGRLEDSCYNCGKPLSSSRLGQRITLWCNSCQD